MGKLNLNFVLVCLTMIVCTIVGVYGFLGVHHADTQAFLSVAGTVVGPLVGILWNNLATRKLGVKVATIEKNTNGTLTKLVDDIPVQVRNIVSDILEPSKEGDKPNAD